MGVHVVPFFIEGKWEEDVRVNFGKQGAPIDTQDLRSILERTKSVRHACDLDLLLFFYRHPRTLLTRDPFVSWLGYDREQIAKSLAGLIEAGFLTQSQNPSHAAGLYVLELRGEPGELLSSLLKFAATREGRQSVMRLLESGPDRPLPPQHIAD